MKIDMFVYQCVVINNYFYEHTVSVKNMYTACIFK